MQPSISAAQTHTFSEIEDASAQSPKPVATSSQVISIEPAATGVAANCASAGAPTKLSIYGSFSLGGSEFALPVGVVQEVVNEPAGYTTVPLSPDYLLGLFNLRGNIIPVVDLSRIFNLDVSTLNEPGATEEFETRKVAILEFDNLCLGLLFDATGEVFNSNDVETCLFEDSGASVQDQVIAGVFKMHDGLRIVQLLDVHGMLQLDRIPQSPHNGGASASARRRGKRRQCISFEVGDSCCALDIGAIKEIVNIGTIENTVLAGFLCLGAIDLRGTTVPVVDFSMLLGYADIPIHELHESDSHRVIIMKVGDHLFGLLVSQINSIVSYFDDELTPFPILGNQKTAMFKGYIAGASSDTGTIVLEQSEIFSSDEIHTITKGHSALFKGTEDPSFTEKQGSLDRKTLITFSLGNAYGLEISEVAEVIDYPSELIKTPTMGKHIRGMVNLRGELIAIIDTRHLYGFDEFVDHESTKVLVFEIDDIKYGLMVDTVNSIVAFRESDTIKIPRTAFTKDDDGMNEDVKQAVMILSGDAQQTVCVLNLESVVARATSVS